MNIRDIIINIFIQIEKLHVHVSMYLQDII